MIPFGCHSTRLTPEDSTMLHTCTVLLTPEAAFMLDTSAGEQACSDLYDAWRMRLWIESPEHGHARHTLLAGR